MTKELTDLEKQAIEWYAEKQRVMDCDYHAFDENRLSRKAPDAFRKNIQTALLGTPNAAERIVKITSAYMEFLAEQYGIQCAYASRSPLQH